MRGRHLVRLLVAALVAGAGFSPEPASAAATATVLVDANAFEPEEVSVDPSGTVTWLVQEGGHTIAADDGRFLFRGSGGATLPAGTAVRFAFSDTDELVGYFCEIHGGAGGQGMAGRVRVGTPPEPPPYSQPVIRVPEDAPTLAAAVDVAAPGHRIELAPGDHAITEPVSVDVDEVTIAGTDSTSRLVPRVGGDGFPNAALVITASRVRVERLEVGAFRAAGIHLAGANMAEIVDVHVRGSGFTLEGIVATAVTGVTMRGSTSADNRGTGVRVADCAACGVVVDSSVIRGNPVGVLVEGARGVTIRSSSIDGNGTGVLARSSRSTAPLRPAVVAMTDNVFSANGDEGIRLTGTADSLVTRNQIIGSDRAVVVAGDLAQDTNVSTNVVDGTLVWDGLGIDVDFTDNRDPSGFPAEPVLDPTASLQ